MGTSTLVRLMVGGLGTLAALAACAPSNSERVLDSLTMNGEYQVSRTMGSNRDGTARVFDLGAAKPPTTVGEAVLEYPPGWSVEADGFGDSIGYLHGPWNGEDCEVSVVVNPRHVDPSIPPDERPPTSSVVISTPLATAETARHRRADIRCSSAAVRYPAVHDTP